MEGQKPRSEVCSPSVFSVARHPMQVLLFWAKAMRPPTLEVSTVLQRVWSPSEGNTRSI